MKKLTIRSLVAAAVASLALFSVGSAHAGPKRPSPDYKWSCFFKLPDGTAATYLHGESVTVTFTLDGKTYKATYKCNDGKWEQVKTRTIGDVVDVGTGSLSVSDGGGTLVSTAPKISSGAITPRINLGIAP